MFFCICPELAPLKAQIRERDASETIDDSLQEYFPDFEKHRPLRRYERQERGVRPEADSAASASHPGPDTPPETKKIKPTRGMISIFEENVRKRINDAILNGGGTIDSDVRPPSGPRFALHGCEVNNYFYTEKFDNLIMVLPVFNPTNLPRCHIASETFVKLACGEPVVDPGYRINTPVGPSTYEEYTFDLSRLNKDYLFIFNLQWGTSSGKETSNLKIFEELHIAARLQKMLVDAWVKVEKDRADMAGKTDAPFLQQSLGDQIHSEITRIAFYAGYYFYVFKGIQKFHTWDDAAKLAGQNIFNGLQNISAHASNVRESLNSIVPVQDPTFGLEGAKYKKVVGLMKTHLSHFLTHQSRKDIFDDEKSSLLHQLEAEVDPTAAGYISENWFFQPGYDFSLDNRKFMEEVYTGLREKLAFIEPLLR